MVMDMEGVRGTDGERKGERAIERERERESARTTNTPPLFFALHPGRPHLCQGSRLSLRGSSWRRTEMPNNLSEIRGDAPRNRSSLTHCSSLIIDTAAVYTLHFGAPGLGGMK